MFKRVLSLCLVLATVVCGGGGALASTPITIRLKGAFNEGMDSYYYLPQLIESVYERSNGTVTVVWGAGPEAIPASELGEAMSAGIVEMVYVPMSFLASHAPGLLGTNLTDPAVMRENGGVEFMDSITRETVNSRFLARAQNGSSFVLGVAEDVNSVADLQGMIIRGTVSNRGIIVSVGAEMTSMPFADVRQALDRNVIQGAASTIRDFVDFSMGGIIKTLILPGLFTSDAYLLIANHIWDRLDDVQKEALMSSAIDWEVDSLRYNTRMHSESVAILEAAGTRILELTGDERDEYIRRAHATAWEINEARDPETARKLREFTEN